MLTSFIIHHQGAFVFMIVRTDFLSGKHGTSFFLVNDENILTHSEAFNIVTDHI